jgi:hypothetical protein
MAVEKDKVLAAIESKFKGKSISKTFKQNLAAKWAEKIDTEDDIDTYIEDREDIITEAISEADRRATDAATKAAEKAKQAGKNTETEVETEEEDLKDLSPEMKAVLKRLDAVASKVEGFEQAQSQKSIAERFKADERLKGIPEFMFKGRVPSKEEDFETYAEELKADYEAFATEKNLERFGNDTPGATGNKTPAGGNGKVSDTIKQLATAVNPKDN